MGDAQEHTFHGLLGVTPTGEPQAQLVVWAVRLSAEPRVRAVETGP